MNNFEIMNDWRMYLKPMPEKGMGDGLRYIYRLATKFCKGNGLDIGATQWKKESESLPGAIPVDLTIPGSGSATDLSLYYGKNLDFVFSSHCLEHVSDPEAAVNEVLKVLKSGGIYFLYLPYPGHYAWDPAYCEEKYQAITRREHIWQPSPLSVNRLLVMAGFKIEYSEWDKDLLHSFTVVGKAP